MPLWYKMPALCLRDSRASVQILQQPWLHPLAFFPGWLLSVKLLCLGFIPPCIAFCLTTGSADDPYVGPGNLAHPVPPLTKHKILLQRRKLVDVQHLMGHQAQLLTTFCVIVKHCLSPFQHVRWWRWRISGWNQTKKK